MVRRGVLALLLQPFLLQPFLLFPFDFLNVLPKGFPVTTALSRRRNVLTEALHLPVIKALQNLESKIDQPGGKVFEPRGPSGCRRETRRAPIPRPVVRFCDLDAMCLIASGERRCILISGTDQIRPQEKDGARFTHPRMC